ncbi:DUF3825 domain-containing protein [Streptomyces anthocyanicus]|uniref:DUF3825 domain-containing protein n=1 Tax=Streptomyces anthocyanicus TaxID=68174 RepID=UPI00380610AF
MQPPIATPLTAMPKNQPSSASSTGKHPESSDGAETYLRGGDELLSFAWLGRLRSSDERRRGEGPADTFDSLAKAAAPENWDGFGPSSAGSLSVLKNYVARTFDQALAQQSVIPDTHSQLCVFNTGLTSPRNEDIYGLFAPATGPGKQLWRLKDWRTSSSYELSAFTELPEPPTYTTDPFEFCFDWEMPLSFTAQVLSRTMSALLPGAQEMPYGLELALNAAVGNACTLAKRNPGTAVPMWHEQKREIQLLLPLHLVTPETPNAALAISRGETSYLGVEVLSLEEAYKAARVVARPSARWLAPELHPAGPLEGVHTVPEE